MPSWLASTYSKSNTKQLMYRFITMSSRGKRLKSNCVNNDGYRFYHERGITYQKAYELTNLYEYKHMRCFYRITKALVSISLQIIVFMSFVQRLKTVLI